MAKNAKSNDNDIALLLKHILAIELWRSGLSQAQIRQRLGLSMNVVNDMLKGIHRHVSTRSSDSVE